MTRSFFVATILGLAALAAAAEDDHDVLFQVSTIDALLAGVYDPQATVGEALTHGDFGLGTFEGLNGELILFEGQVYQAAYDGTISRMPAETGTPFIAVTHFDRDQQLEVTADQTYADFKIWLESALPSRNMIYAVRVDGHFSHMVYRSVPRQTKPYPPLAEASKEQAVFEQQNLRGSLIGFWCPSFVKGLNVPGFHLHFLSDDRQHGGHLLDFSMSAGTVSLDDTNGWNLDLPKTAAFLDSDLGADRSAALHTVEQGTQGQGRAR